MTAAATAAAALNPLLWNARPIGWALLPVPPGVPEWLKLAGDLALKGALLLAAAMVVTALLRRAAAAVRHLVWCCAFLGLLLLPALELLLPAWRVKLVAPAASIDPAWQIRPAEVAAAPISPQGGTADGVAQRSTLDGGTAGSAERLLPSAGASPVVAAPHGRPTNVIATTPAGAAFDVQRLLGWIGAVLLLVAAALLGRVALAHAAARLLVRRARAGAEPHWARLLDACRGEMRLRRAVGLRLTAERAMPLTTGHPARRHVDRPRHRPPAKAGR